MHLTITRRAAAQTLAAAALPFAPGAFAQAYPNKPVKILVGSPAAGPSDFLARAFADAAAQALNQAFVIDNKPGASGTLAGGMMPKAPADGYTLFASGPAAIVMAPHVYAKLEYDPEKDLTPIAMLGAGAFVVAVHPSVPANTITELIALAKSKPGAVNYGSGGNGSSGHVCSEMFAARAGVEMTHVPYKGDTPAMTDLLGGQIQIMFTAPNVAMAQHKAGKVKIIAVTSRERMMALQDVPSVHETLPGFENLGWIILFAHANTPAPTLDTLAAVWATARNQPALKAKIDGLGMYPPAQYGSREAVAAFLKGDRARLVGLVKRLNITPS